MFQASLCNLGDLMTLDLPSPIATTARKCNQLFLCTVHAFLVPCCSQKSHSRYLLYLLSANGRGNLTDGPGNLKSLERNGILMTRPLWQSKRGKSASLLEQTWGTDSARSSWRLTRLPEYVENEVFLSLLCQIYIISSTERENERPKF